MILSLFNCEHGVCMFSKHVSVKYFNFLHKCLTNLLLDTQSQVASHFDIIIFLLQHPTFCSKYTGIPLIFVFRVYPAILLTLTTIGCLRFSVQIVVVVFEIMVVFLPFYFYNCHYFLLSYILLQRRSSDCGYPCLNF